MGKADRFPLLLLGDALILNLLLAGGLFAYLSVYLAPHGLPENRLVLLAACALFSALSAGLWTLRRGGWIVLGLLCTGALILWDLWERLGPAFRLMECAASLTLSGRGAGVEVLQLTAQEWQAGTEVLTPALLVLAFLLALGLSWIVRVNAWYLAALAVTAPVLPAILAGILPDWTALMASAAGWGTLLLSALYNLRDKRRLGRGVLVNLAGMCALLSLLTAALPREGYQRPQWATSARNSLVTAISEGVNGWLEWDVDLSGLGLDLSGLGLDLPGESGAAVGMLDSGEEDLLQAGPRRYSGWTVLTVRTDQPDPAGRIYLRGGSAAVYTGQSWETADPSLYARWWMYAGQETSFPGGSGPEEAVSHMTIRHSRAGGSAAFYPYFPAGGGLVFDADGLAARAGQTYAVDYVPLEDGERLTAPELEEGYRAFAYQQYLDVPDRARRALSPLLDLSQAPVDDGRELPENLYRVESAQRIAAALAQAAYYDPNTPAMEPGEDFVERFLREGRGYCVHFATAGTLLLRMQGIPARYVTGYTALLDRSGRAAVTDSAAHAWVEIYVDGFGWYPVEMTPGYRAPGGGLAEHPAPLASNEAQPAPDEDPSTPEEEEDNTIDPEDRNHPEDSEDPGADESPAGGEEDGRASVDLTWLKYLLLAAAIAALPAAAYRFAARLRRRSRVSPDTNRSVIDAYLRCRRVLRWGIGEMDPRLEELARKAKFSQHRLTVEERTAAWTWLEELRSRTETALPAWKYWAARAMRPLL